jgi:predicted GNAT family acetyltransferase
MLAISRDADNASVAICLQRNGADVRRYRIAAGGGGGRIFSGNRQGHQVSGEVRNNPEQNHFELEVEGHTAIAVYALSAGVITFTHTEVPSALEGRGIGSKLARGALDAARAQGLKVMARCPFIAGYIRKHAEYQDLLK